MTCDDVRRAKSHDYPYEFSEATGPQYAWEVLRFEYDLADKEFSKLRWRSGWNSLSSSEASIQRRDSAPELIEVCIGSPTTIKSRRSYTRTVLRETGEKDVSTEWFESLMELEGGFVARECPRQE